MKMKYYKDADDGVLVVETDEGEKMSFGSGQGAMYPKFWHFDKDSVIFRKSEMPSYLNEKEKYEIFHWAIRNI